MPAKNIRLKFWGVRGSLPTPGPSTVKYGGNTTCVEIQCGDELFIIDGGSGVRELGMSLLKQMPVKATWLFTHYHWDHIMGVPFFVPAMIPGNEFTIYGQEKRGRNVRRILSDQMVFPYFPVGMDIMGASLKFRKAAPGKKFGIGDAKVRTHLLHHPFGCLGYRFDYNGSSIAHICDYEHYPREDTDLIKFVEGCDAIIYDASYTPEEYEDGKQGWGHSTWEKGCELVEKAGVGRLYLTHHEPNHDDKFMAKIEREAKQVYKNTRAAKEGEESWF